MPLRDMDWKKNSDHQLSFFFAWSASVSDALNKQLPPMVAPSDRRFSAEVVCRTRLKTVEDITSFNHGSPTLNTFEPPEPTLVAPARFTDRLGVHVIDSLEGKHIAAAVLFVDEDHKADSDGALAFAVYAASLMSAGVGVVIVDILPGPPNWATHLHSLVGVYPITRRPRGGEAPILVVRPEAGGSPHPKSSDSDERFAVWHRSVAVGFPLPTVPVPVRGAMHMNLDLEATYLEACERTRLL